MAKLPYMQFYPSDFMMDAQILSMEERGCWISLMCYVWINSDTGTVRLSNQELAHLWGMEIDASNLMLMRLWEKSIFDMRRHVPSDTNLEDDDDKIINTITSRRIKKDKNHLKTQAERQRRFYNKHNAKPNADLTHKKSDVRHQKSEGASVARAVSSSPAPKKKSLPDPSRAAKAAPQVAPKPYPKPDPTTNPSGALICAYKERKGVGWANRDWDRKHYPRAKKLAIEMITTCGGLNAAWRCVKELGNRFTEKGLDWNLSTIVKHSDDWVAKQREENTESEQEANDYAHMGGESVHTTDVIPRSGNGSEGFRTAGQTLGSIVDRIRNRAPLSSEGQKPERLRNPGDDDAPQDIRAESAVEATTD